MGNKFSNQPNIEQQRKLPQKRTIEQTLPESTPERKWIQSQKTIQDLKQLMRQDKQWPQILRSFLSKITIKQEYQQYLRAILQQLLESQCNFENQNSHNQIHQFDKQNDEQAPLKSGLLLKEGNNLPQLNVNTVSSPKNKKELMQLFKFYKTRLEQSYFVMTHQKGGVRQNIGDFEFEASLKQLQGQNGYSSVDSQSNFVSIIIPSLMVSQLYQYSSIKQTYLNEMFMELNLKVYESLEQFATCIIEEFIIVEDEFNLAKFIVDHDVLMKSLVYLQTCAKLMQHTQRVSTFEKIKKIKSNPPFHYIGMCRIFLKYKNVQSAQVIMRSMIQKGYHLSQEQLRFYFYIQVYGIFLYEINYSVQQLKECNIGKQLYQLLQLNGSFVPFIQCFEKLQIEDIMHMFFSLRSYNEIELVKKCFQTVFGLYEPLRGQHLFMKHLKSYALGDRAHFIITIQALKNHLSSLKQQDKQDIQGLFLHKLSLQKNFQIVEYERHVVEVSAMYHFSKEAYDFIKILFKVSCILSKFEISLRVSQLCEFLFQNSRQGSFGKLKEMILVKSSLHKRSTQELQFEALIIIKKVITKYFTLGQYKQQVVFVIQDKFDQECFQYSTREIESLFIMTQYLHKKLFEPFVPLQQLHQLLFQHMLYFYRYDQVQTMLKEENLSRYFIQKEVVKMLILQNIREMLVKSEKEISVISQDIKKQLKLVQSLIHEKEPSTNNLLEFETEQNMQKSQLNPIEIDFSQIEQLQSIRSLFRLMIRLDFYSISLNEEQKQNININLLYFLIEHYEHQIQVFGYDQLYRLIVLVEGKHHHIIQDNLKLINVSSVGDSSIKGEVPITNQYLKFKIDLAHLCYERGRIKFGENILKQVLQYQPPWISSQIIKIIRKSPHSTAINHSFLNIAFEYCVKGQDLVFLLEVWRLKMSEKQKKTGKKITQLFETTKKYIIVDDSYVKDQKQYRNLVAQMTFNDQTIKSKNYQLFFTLLGTQPQRAFYMIYSKWLDIVKIEIILKQGMKTGIFNTLNVTKIFFKLFYFIIENQKSKLPNQNKNPIKISYVKFRDISIEEIIQVVQISKILEAEQKNKSFQKQIPFILLKKMYKALKSILILPPQFIRNYLENSCTQNNQQTDTQFLYRFLYDQNYRQKHLIALKDQPMGKNDIRLYRQLCFMSGLNILDLIIFNLTNQVNTVEINVASRLLQDERIQNVLQKIVTWTEKDPHLLQDILSKLIQRIFSSQMFYNIISYMREKENPLIRQIVTEQHMQILQSLKQIQVNTQLHGLISEQFFTKPISFNPKQNLSQKHTKILKKQLKLRNVFLISKIMYFCYGMSTQVQKQVLKIFIKENENEEEKQIFEQLKAKLHESER